MPSERHQACFLCNLPKARGESPPCAWEATLLWQGFRTFFPCLCQLVSHIPIFVELDQGDQSCETEAGVAVQLRRTPSARASCGQPGVSSASRSASGAGVPRRPRTTPTILLMSEKRPVGPGRAHILHRPARFMRGVCRTYCWFCCEKGGAKRKLLSVRRG